MNFHCLSVLALALILPRLVLAQDAGENFENLSQELPGWSATLNPGEYRPASKWDTPIAFALDADKPHGGSTSLRLDFIEAVDGMTSFGPVGIPVPDEEVTIRFFVRTESLSGEGIFSFDESELDGKRIKGHWAAAQIPSSEEWTEVVWTGKLGSATPALRLRFIWKSAPAGAKVWIDDLTVTAAGSEGAAAR